MVVSENLEEQRRRNAERRALAPPEGNNRGFIPFDFEPGGQIFIGRSSHAEETDTAQVKRF
jgi:hypothetical protein